MFGSSNTTICLALLTPQSMIKSFLILRPHSPISYHNNNKSWKFIHAIKCQEHWITQSYRWPHNKQNCLELWPDDVLTTEKLPGNIIPNGKAADISDDAGVLGTVRTDDHPHKMAATLGKPVLKPTSVQLLAMSRKAVLKLATVQLFATLTDQSNLYWTTSS